MGLTVVPPVRTAPGFGDGSLTPDARPGKLKTIADTRVWMRAFFDGTVRDDWADLKKRAGESPPEMAVHGFGK